MEGDPPFSLDAPGTSLTRSSLPSKRKTDGNRVREAGDGPPWLRLTPMVAPHIQITLSLSLTFSVLSSTTSPQTQPPLNLQPLLNVQPLLSSASPRTQPPLCVQLMNALHVSSMAFCTMPSSTAGGLPRLGKCLPPSQEDVLPSLTTGSGRLHSKLTVGERLGHHRHERHDRLQAGRLLAAAAAAGRCRCRWRQS